MLNKIHIKNFKSIKDLHAPLKPLNVLIGPNNSGKSNIFEALMFLKEVITLNPFYAVIKKRGTFSDISHGFQRAGEISINADFDLSENQYSYQVTISSDPYQEKKIASETLSRGTENDLININLGKGNYYSFHNKSHVAIQREGVILNHLKADLYEDPYHEIFDYFNAWTLSHPVPAIMKSSFNFSDTTLMIEENGENVDLVLDSISRKYQNNFSQIIQFLNDSLKEFQSIWFEIKEGTLVLNWKEKDFACDIQKRLLSDGVLKLLHMLALIYHPEPPSLVLIEEPENYIHPSIIQRLAEGIKSLARKTQVMLSTHSSDLVDFFPEESFILVEKINGQTRWQGFDPTKDEEGSFKDQILKGLWG